MLTRTGPGDLVVDPVPLVDRIVTLYERLSALDDLAPSPVVDALFGTLVGTCVATSAPDAAQVLADPRVDGLRPHLLQLCAEGEALLENAWARRALAAGDAGATVARFPYLANYADLTRLEVHALAGAGKAPDRTRHVCFVGGGPLPLSALMLHRELGARVTVVDRDDDAVDLSRRLLARLLPDGAVRVLRADATSADDLAAAVCGCDVVVVAALVGLDRAQKQDVLRTLADAVDPGAFAVVRSADGLRALLYPVVEVQDVTDAGLAPQVLVHPLGDVVNSVLVARRD